MLGDSHYNAPEVRTACVESEKFFGQRRTGTSALTPGWRSGASSTGRILT